MQNCFSNENLVLKEQLVGKNISQIRKKYALDRYLNHLVDPRFQGENRLFVLSFENENGRTSHSEYHLPKVEMKDYHVMNFDQPIKNDFKTYETIRKIATGQGYDYTTGYLLDYL